MLIQVKPYSARSPMLGCAHEERTMTHKNLDWQPTSRCRIGFLVAE